MPSGNPKDHAGDAGPPKQRIRMCVAPWYSVEAKGFVPRIYLLDETGWPVGHVDGIAALPTYAEAVEAALLLRPGTDEPTAA
jgi:hypothetical protein